MITPYLTFNGTCEEAFAFYADAFGCAEMRLARLNDNPLNPVMHASLSFAQCKGGLTGADVDKPVVVSGMAINVVMPSREIIEKTAAKLAVGGSIVQSFTPHPPPHQNDGACEVYDRYGFTWYLST